MVANPPYIPDSDWHRVAPAVADYEPRLALWVADADPLVFYRHIATWSSTALRAGGWLYLECNDHYVAQVVALLKKNGYLDVETLVDMQGHERHVRARRL